MQFIISLQQALAALVIILGSLITIGTYVYKIYKQLIPNSGSSLRDQIDKLNIKADKLNLIQMVYLDNVAGDIPMFVADKNGKCEWVNKAYLKFTGKSMGDLVGNNWACSVHQDDREKIETEWEHTSNKSRNFDMVYRFIVNGKSIKVHCQAWGNERTGYCGIIKNIEEEKENKK